MRRKRFTTEQIIAKPREAEVKLSQGKKTEHICRELNITNNTYCRWRKECGGLGVPQIRRLKELEKENTRLKKIIAEQALDNSWLEMYHFFKIS